MVDTTLPLNLEVLSGRPYSKAAETASTNWTLRGQHQVDAEAAADRCQPDEPGRPYSKVH